MSGPTLIQYLTPLEIAHSLKVNVKTVLRWLKDPNHPLTGTKINKMWRIDPEHFAAYIKGDLNK